jgi:protein phosphatase
VLVALARQYHFVSVAIALDVRESVCHARNQQRADRTLARGAIERQAQQMRRALRGLKREGFRYIYTLSDENLVADVSVERQPVWTDRRSEHGPFDIIGDIHGCRAELESLLERLGYDLATLRHPNERKLVFLGDLVDRGPDVTGVLRIAMRAVAGGSALCVPGNHEVKLLRWLRGEKVRVSHGLTESIAQMERESPECREQVVRFIDSLISHYVLDDGKLVVAHAGMNAAMQGRASRTVREFALYGDTTGETDEFGFPVRYDWAAEYRGRALVVYGHTPNVEPER